MNRPQLTSHYRDLEMVFIFAYQIYEIQISNFVNIGYRKGETTYLKPARINKQTSKQMLFCICDLHTPCCCTWIEDNTTLGWFKDRLQNTPNSAIPLAVNNVIPSTDWTIKNCENVSP